MTSREEWAWRAEHLCAQADLMEEQASKLLEAAARYRELAKRASENATEPAYLP